MDDPKKVFRILIKFMDEQYVDSFIKEGLLFMNNIEFFRNYEDTDVALRGDQHEGLAASYKAEELIIEFADHVFDGVEGRLDIRYDAEDETNIYSMTKISDENILEAGDSGLFLSEKFKNFGNRAIIISGSDIGEFERRLKLALSNDPNIYTTREDNVLAKRVSYLEREKHHGALDVFDKFSAYSWQYEWRIAFKQRNSTGAYPLRIGNVEDIAQVHETESLLDKPIRLIPKSK
ncbi:hypothetical protein [Shewanella sp. KJ2020]|uniref:hypothetical protein n=1 Tax=Shewanella sp. KJ2020 TaxID=2919172 RepID=UPI0020A7395D|nr:hypothetical protein [Shewanella sp. KJ2020]MCP3130061.1 hypothetical protein [Shewanella sp. KJ2020]